MLDKIRELMDTYGRTKIIGIFLIVVVLLAVGLTVIIAQQRQSITQRASEPVSPPFPSTVTPSPSQSDISLALLPSADPDKIQIGNQMYFDLIINTGDQELTGIDFTLKFTKNILLFQGSEFGDTENNKIFNNILFTNTDNSTTYRFAAVNTQTSSLSKGEINLGKIFFLPSAFGQASLTFENAQVTVLGSNESRQAKTEDTIVVVSAPTPTAGATNTPVPTIPSVTPKVNVTVSADSPTQTVTKGTTNVLLAKFDLKAIGERVRLDKLFVNFDSNNNSISSLNNAKYFFNGIEQTKHQGWITERDTGLVFWNDIELNQPVLLGLEPTYTFEVRADITDHSFKQGDTIQIRLARATGTNATVFGSNQVIDVPDSNVDANIVTITESISPTPIIPTNTPTSVPPSPTPTIAVVLGDANGDNNVDILDFNIWRTEFLNGGQATQADFNNDGVVDLTDFAIWRNAFNPSSPSPTSTASSSKRVFVTSTRYSGNLGGLSGADAKCQERANSQNLGGTWKAWLSDSTTSVNSRFNQSSNAYVSIKGDIIANNWEDLTDGTLQNLIFITELGRDTGGSVWTNTKIDGSLKISDANQTCLDFTNANLTSGAIYGTSRTNHNIWTDNPSINTVSCGQSRSLYCFEQ